MLRFSILAMMLLVTFAAVPSASAQERFEFKLGFKLLADQIPAIAGQPLEDEYHNPLNGDALQQTTRGLMVWRKADNWTAFTDGSLTWINGPLGVQSRPNDDRFPWEAGPVTAPAPVAPPPAARGGTSELPRVNAFRTPGSGGIRWSDASVFWFGRATEHDNYVDVRVGYDDRALYLPVAVYDYHFWYDKSAASDPRQHDAVAIYLDMGSSRPGRPGEQQFLFVSGFRHEPLQNDPSWQRQARGNGADWDFSWVPAQPWTDEIGLRYDRSGSNDNSDRDAGWITAITIPWATLGLSGPPTGGQVWGLGVQMFDRDDAHPADPIAPKSWPSGLREVVPSSWGLLAFDPAPYQTPHLPPNGTTVVRRGLDGATVSDAYVGGGGDCGGGKFGGGDTPHPNDHLFVQNQSDTSDFPCFSKSYLKFDLSRVPAGKVILSAELKIYSFGNSEPSQALPSRVQLFTVSEAWDEATLTWNNAPMAQENVAVAEVGVINQFPGWPGVSNAWDATQAVAEAYAADRPVNLALYSADTTYHSGKYFESSDAGDWNASGRPTLTITWADAPGPR